MLTIGLKLKGNSQNTAALTFCITLCDRSSQREEVQPEMRDKLLLDLPVYLLTFFLLSLCVLSLLFAHLSMTSSLFTSPQPSPSFTLASHVSFSPCMSSSGSDCRRMCGCWNSSGLRSGPEISDTLCFSTG